MRPEKGEAKRGTKPRAAREGSSPPAYAKRTVRGKGGVRAQGTDRIGAGLRGKLIAKLEEIEREGGDGKLELADGSALNVTSLGKIFFPTPGFTKGDLMRYYVRTAPCILPAMADRPLVLKRFPNGVGGDSFFQQNAGETPDIVRTETIHTEGGTTNVRIVGGNLATLLYTVQLGAISVDPWHSRVQSLDNADYTILDLDPGPRARFSDVVQVALHVKEVMDELGLHGAVKTSGATGMHIYIPLPPGTPPEAATLVARIVATQVAERHPREATIERAVKARPAAAVYVDYLQNIIGKTVAAAYSVRAKEHATVSTPLEWNELTPKLNPRAFTIGTAPARFVEKGDIWRAQLRRKNSLRRLLK